MCYFQGYVKYTDIDLHTFQNAQRTTAKLKRYYNKHVSRRGFTELSQHDLSFVFSFLNLFILMQVTWGKRLVTFNHTLHRSKFDVCFAFVGTSTSDSGAVNTC